MAGDSKKRSGRVHVSGQVRVGGIESADVTGCLFGTECSIIGSHSIPRKIRKNEAVYSQGELDDNLYVVDTGAVKLARITPHGNTLVTDIVGKRMLFGGICDSGEQKRKESAIAIEDGFVHVVSRDDLQSIENKSPQLAVKMNGLISSRKLRVEDRLVQLLFRSVEQRFAQMLIALVEDFGTPHKKGYMLDIPLTHQDYADLIASTRETVTNVLNRLKKNGILESKGKNLIIRSVEKLTDITR